jgi:hypothetical protein
MADAKYLNGLLIDSAEQHAVVPSPQADLGARWLELDNIASSRFEKRSIA